MRPLWAISALALPAVLLTACAEGPKQVAAPKAKPSVAAQQPNGQPLVDKYSQEAPEETTTAKPGASPSAASETPEQLEKKLGATAAGAKPVYNNPKPKGFKRWNAPGAYNVTRLLYPKREYFGVFHETQDSLGARNALGRRVGVQPNMVKRFVAWNEPFNTAWARGLWLSGAIPQVEWENHSQYGAPTTASIASGAQDAYIRQFAKSVRAFNRPVVMSWGHEMNGDWYSWGFCSKPGSTACQYKTTPTQFKAAWRRMVKIFRSEGATNAIWNWTVNQIHARPNVRLKHFYPGDTYVDWVGAVGYYYPERRKWIDSFGEIFNATFVEIRKFTRKPILLNETASASANRDAKDVKDFLTQVARRPYVIGFIWFNYNKKVVNPAEENWSLDASPAKFNTFRSYIRKYPFGFNPTKR